VDLRFRQSAICIHNAYTQKGVIENESDCDQRKPHDGQRQHGCDLDPVLDGMREAGAEVQVYYTKRLNILPCQGEYNCQIKTPGKCFLKDDMEMLLPKFAEANIQIFATPVYVTVWLDP